MTFSKACLCFYSVNIVLVVFAVVMMERDVWFSWQGRYEILSLSGSYLLQDTGGGGRQRTGGLSVSLAGTDGRVIGGGVAGLLVAASPIQVGYQVDGCLCFFTFVSINASFLTKGSVNPFGVLEILKLVQSVCGF
jgi:hypothetical protein